MPFQDEFKYLCLPKQQKMPVCTGLMVGMFNINRHPFDEWLNIEGKGGVVSWAMMLFYAAWF